MRLCLQQDLIIMANGESLTVKKVVQEQQTVHAKSASAAVVVH